MLARTGNAVGRTIGLLCVLWLFYAITVTFSFVGFDLRQLGLQPRTLTGLIGIFTMPFLHANLQHLFLNSIAIFTALVPLYIAFHDEFHMPEALVKMAIVSGVLVWIFGRGDSIHIGASAVCYGLSTYMVFGAWVHRKPLLFAFAIGTFLISFSSFFYGLVPHDPRISWEGHLCGAIAGILVALGEKNRPATKLLAEAKP